MSPLQRPLSEIFQEQWPYYLAMGMPYGEFWHGAPELTRYYRKAEQLKATKSNNDMWLQGHYFYAAISAAIARQISGDRKANYYSEPIELFHEKEARVAQKRAKAISFLDSFALLHKKNKGEGNEHRATGNTDI